MTMMQSSTSYGPVVPRPGEAAETDRLLRLAMALGHSARRSEDNVIALGERIAIAPQYLRSAPREYAASFVQAP